MSAAFENSANLKTDNNNILISPIYHNHYGEHEM